MQYMMALQVHLYACIHLRMDTYTYYLFVTPETKQLFE